MDDSLKISFEEKPEPDDVKFIAGNLDKFNCSRVGFDDFKSLNSFCARKMARWQEVCWQRRCGNGYILIFCGWTRSLEIKVLAKS